MRAQLLVCSVSLCSASQIKSVVNQICTISKKVQTYANNLKKKEEKMQSIDIKWL